MGGDPPTKSLGTRLDLTLNTRSPTQCFEHSNDIEIKMALVFFILELQHSGTFYKNAVDSFINYFLVIPSS